ncbi:MAG: hypothetical protein K2H01_12450 [Ruminococcus sp.]|nr:hypothetical protein [Ruminococcus sp.]
MFEGVGSVEKSFIGILDGIKNCFKAFQTELKAEALLKIAKAIGIVAASILVLSIIPENKIGNAVNAMAIAVAGLSALAISLGAIKKDAVYMTVASSAILKLATSIAVLAISLKIIGSMDPKEVALGGGTVIALIITLVKASKALNKKSEDIKNSYRPIKKLASALVVLATSIKIIGSMDLPDVAQGLISIVVLLASLSLFATSVSDVDNITKAAAAVLILSAAIGMLGLSCRAFNSDLIGNMVLALGSLAMLLTELTIALNHMGEKSLENSKGLFVAAASMLVLAPALAILGNLELTTIGIGLSAMAGAFAVLGISGKLLSPVAPAILNLGKSMMFVSASIFVFGAGLTLIGTGLTTIAIGFGSLAVAGAAGATAVVTALTIIIVGIAELIPFIISKIGEGIIALIKVIKNEKKAVIEAFVEIILTLLDAGERCIPRLAEGVLTLVDSVLKSLVEHTPSIIDSIFDFIIKIIEGIAKNVPRLIKVAMSIFASFFSGIINALNSMDTESLLQGTACIGILTAVVIALGTLASFIPAAMVGVLGMGIVIAELALVLAAVGALAQIPGLEWLINEGGDLLQGIGTAIGKFVGGIAGGFTSGVSSQFPQIGSDLSDFMTNVQPFIYGASNIKPSMMEGARALAETILILTAANILDGLTSWFTGGSSLSDFAQELIPFGTAMKQFSEEVKDIGSDDISAAATAGKILAEMADTIPNSGGLLGFLAGNNDMDDFGKKLVPFGEGITEFATTVEGIETDDIQKAANAGKTLTELADTIPNSEGLLGFLAGNNDIDDFGKKLVPFGEAITEYSQSVVDLKSDAIQNSVSAAKSLVEIANTLENSGGVISWFTGDNNLDTFGEQLVSFGKSFAEYYNSVSNIDASKLNGVIVEFQNLVDLANGVKDVDTSGISNFAKNLTDLGNEGIDGFINAFTDSNSRVSTAANTMVTTFINGVKIQNGTLTIVFTTMVNSMCTAFTSQYHQFTTIGSTVMTKLIAGVRIKDPTLRNTFVTIISGGLTSMRNKYTDFYDTGKYLVEGFAKGIDEYTWYAESKARAMASAAARAAEKELDINSPSKVGYRIGGFFSLGFVNSIIDYTDKSYEAGTVIASAAKDGLYRAVSNIRDFIDGNIDSQPTIRPVLDLSSVRSEVGKLSAILSRSQATKISTAIERDISATVQNSENTPAVGNSYSFIQNNYSPKALSRGEIYRQTKNQFSAMKRMVNI